MKFGRNYRLTVEIAEGEAIVIEPPLTVEFNIIRSTSASINLGDFKVYNLSESRRREIFQDRFDFLNAKHVIFEAGYSKLTKIFEGYIFLAESARNKSDIITHIQARDGFNNIRNSQVNETYPAGITVKELIQNLIGGFDDLEEGVISEYDETLARPVAVDGNRFEIINKYSDGKVYVDLNKVNVVKNADAIEGVVPRFDSNTGLLETPARQGAFLSVKTLFEPNVKMSQLIEIDSSILKRYNGQYKVIGVHHQGVVSGAIGGECTSTFQLLLGDQLFGFYNRI